MAKYIKLSGNLGFNWSYFVSNVGFSYMSYGILRNTSRRLENSVITYIPFRDGDSHPDNLSSFVYTWISTFVLCFIKDDRGV